MIKTIFALCFCLCILPFSHSYATLCCPQPTDYKWVMPTAAIIAIGGGAVAGYGAGTRIERTRATPEAKEILRGGIKVERTLSWIPPTNDTPDGPKIQAEIFTPNDRLYASTTMGKNETLPIIPTLGTEDNPALEGQYRIVFTVIEGGDGPSNLGGITYDGQGLFTPEQNISGGFIPFGTQEILIIDYPSGPFA